MDGSNRGRAVQSGMSNRFAALLTMAMAPNQSPPLCVKGELRQSWLCYQPCVPSLSAHLQIPAP